MSSVSNAKRSRTLRIVVVIFLATLIVGGIYLAQAPASPAAQVSASSPSGGFTAAWQRADQASSYRFTAHIEQTYIPRATASMIGQQNQQVILDMDGDVQQPDRSRVNLRMESQSVNAAPVTVIRDGGKTFIQKGDQLQPADESSNVVIPTSPNSFVDYLSAATNVRQAPDASNPHLTHYLFDLDPTLLFNQLLARIAPGDSPRPILPTFYTSMTGSGELWVNESGLPQRQIIHLNLPQASTEYDAQVQLTLNLSDWNGVPPLPQPVQNSQGTWQLQSGTATSAGHNTSIVPPLSPETRQNLVIVIVFTLIAIAFGLWYVHRRKAATAFLILLVCFALIFNTPLQLFAQSIGNAAPKASIAEALGLASAVPSAQQQAIDRLVQKYQRVQASTATLAQCGSGTPGVDSDRDGLTDQQELCLGTDPYNPDTDGDGVTDYQEVIGFDCDNRHWTTDPLNADSNHDGILDGQQWPDPNNVSGTCDPKGQGAPNVWNMDNDGDGVPNSIDMSPQTATPYSTTFNLQMNYTGTMTDTVYVELEVQPQNMNHLQYSQTWLDWPDGDSQGQIQDLNYSKNDLRLVPMLEIDSNVSNAALADKYGYIVRPGGSNGYLTYAPLQLVSDGGMNKAFYAKVAYAPSELTQPIHWKAQLVWMVQAQNDQYTNCFVDVDHYQKCQIQTTPQVVQIYRNENFRVTGLKLTKSRGFESAVFLTPQYPTEDFYLFRTVLGLSATFLRYDKMQNQTTESALQQITYRFSQPSMPVGLRFEIPNTVTVFMTDTVAAHFDEGLAKTNQTVIPQVLNTYYPTDAAHQCRDATGAVSICATLGLATEYTLGSLDLGNLTVDARGQYLAPLSNVPMVRERSLKAIMYERPLASNTWTADALNRALAIVDKRYANQVANLQGLHPGSTPDDVRLAAYLPYIAWQNGSVTTVNFDGSDLTSGNLSDEQQVVDDSLQLALFNTVEAVELGFDMKELFEGDNFNLDILSRGKLGAAVSKVNSFFSAKNQRARKVMGVANGVLFAASLATEIAKIACGPEDAPQPKCDFKAIESVNAVLQGLQIVGMAVEAIDAFGQLKEADFSTIGNSAFKNYKLNFLEEVKGASGKIAIAGTVITIGLAWTQFGLVAANSNGYTPAVKIALANAIVSTIWAIIMLAISFIPFGIGDLIDAILGLIDAIVQAVTGGDYDLATGLRKVFYDIKTLTMLDNDNTKFAGSTSGVTDEAAGLTPGNTFAIQDQFQATIIEQNGGNTDDLNASSANGYYQAQADSSVATANTTTDNTDCFIQDGKKYCDNHLAAEFKLITPTVNAQLQFTNVFDFQYAYRECGFFGLICGAAEHETVTQEGDPNTIYLDVLPNTLDGLWNWSALGNPDSDGDGVPDSQELGVYVNGHMVSCGDPAGLKCTDPHNLDTDGDGLSDYFEINNSHTNPLKADTDGDGLPDGLEVRLGTDPLNPDSDGDGLKDGEEVFHFDGTNWVGGWNITLPGNLTAHVFSDPLNADADGDGLYDSTERDSQLSPNAYNPGSQLIMTVDPLVNNPSSTWQGAMVAPNGSITFTTSIFAGQAAITTTLKECLPTFLTGLQISAAGDHIPSVQSAACPNGTGLAWNFSGANILQVGQMFTATVVARVYPTITTSISGTTNAMITTAGIVLSDTAKALVDADNPQVSFTAPVNGAILRRDPGGTTYIIGGIANDPASWLTEVQVNVGQGYTTTVDTNVWSYAWNLPPDGNYTLQARAHDYVGHTSSIASTQVLVDGTPPTGTLTLANGIYLRPSANGTIQLVGTASDNLSGLAFVQISLNSQPWQTVLHIPATSSVLSTNWSYTWALPNTNDSGVYNVGVRVIDRAGNESTALTRQVVVDSLPPTSDLTTNFYLGTPDVRAGQPITLVGRANDLGNAPLPSRPATLQGTLDSLTNATAWLQLRKVSDDDSGVRLTWLGDINGDARADFAVGLPNSDNGAGHVYIINGRGGNWPTPPSVEDVFNSTSSFVGAPGAGIGALVSSAGDVNGDGSYDTLIGDPINARVFLIFGRGQPLGRNLPLTGTTDSALWSVLNVSGLGTLKGVSSAGDVNGDGFADMLITMDRGGSVYYTYLLLGHAAPWYPTTDVGLEAAAIAHANDWTATGVGDVNGDHIDDFIVNGQGAVYLFYGSTGFAARNAMSLDGLAVAALGSADTHVTAAALGDVNGDGLSDFLFSNGSTPALVLGRSSGGWGVSRYLSGYPATISGFLAAPGDVNGDGFNDIMVGVPNNNSAYVLLGAGNISAVAPSIAVALTNVVGAASAPYAAGADLNCDQSSDLLLLPAQTPPVSPLGPQPIFEATPFVPQDRLPVAQTPDQSSAPNSFTSQPSKVEVAPAVAYVSAAYCASCANEGHIWGVDAYSSIQAAINSGAPSVFIMPGVYNEVLHLVSGVTVAGSGAETTIVQAPSGSSNSYLVTADGVQTATLRNLSLVGNNMLSGLHAGSGTIGLQIARNIIRNAPNAIVLDGSSTQVEIVNNTIVKNTNGISATNNAGVDVRNTIFALNTGTAVSYQSAAPTRLHQYNDYFGNGADVRIDNGIGHAADGFGEITLDPLFADVASNNYRPLSGSPVIDAGNPSDPTPPGTDGRIDIGYAENGKAAFYASVNYCATCDNDGLIWQWDAFNAIQPALDAAANYLRSIGCIDSTQATQQGFCNTHVTVGVGAGTYQPADTIRVPSYVRLTGVGADHTTLDGLYQPGIPLVAFDGVVDAQISGFKITTSAFGGINSVSTGVLITNSSNSITVTRNLFAGIYYVPNIVLSHGASGNILFNTIDGADTDILAEGANTWANVRDNIIVGAAGDGLGGGGGLVATSGALILSDYNYLNNDLNYNGIVTGTHDIIENGAYPFVNPGVDYSLLANSAPVDAAELGTSVPDGGGERADMGYKELVATPLVLMFGKLGSNACYAGNSGIKQVDVGVVPVANPASYITATLPSTWTTATLQTPGQTASYWTKVITPTTGLSRLYSRATDTVGNTEQPTYDPFTQKFNLYDGAFIGDPTAPIVTLTLPINNLVTTTAAIELIGQASDYISSTFTVADKYFMVNGNQRVTADWLDTGWNGSGPRTFRAVAILPSGTYTVQSQAIDQAGNVGKSAVNNLTLSVPSGSNHVATFLSPANLSWTNQTMLHVNGAALYSSVNGIDQVILTVNGGAALPVTVTSPSSISTAWSADVPLVPGTNTLTAQASNNSGAGPATNLIVQLDVISPTLTTPASGKVITQSATLAGTASDAQSGLAAVEVSVDGGYLWNPAVVNGTNWSFLWNAPAYNQNTSYPVSVRARDRAGNVTQQSLVIVVDNTPPTGFGPIDFNIPIGTYVHGIQTLIMTWTVPTDGGGPVTTTAAIDQISRTLPSALMTGNTLSKSLNPDGQWFAHLTAVDQAGNRTSANYGPWYVTTGLLCSSPQRSIVLDGKIDTPGGEWLSTELMDDDERPMFPGSAVSRDRQALYATWDANAFYLGWHGAWWTLDGTLFAYFDTGAGGTTQPVSPTVPAHSLPFAADYAVAINGPTQGTFYQYIGGAWQAQSGMTFAQSGLGDTEVRLPIAVSTLSDVRMIAFAASDNNAVWSIFPTTNPLNGPWTDAYHWQPICSVTAPNANQPRGINVLTNLTSPQSSNIPYAPNTALQYIVTLDNREARAVPNVQVTLTASAGLTYQSVASPAGTICNACVAGSQQWRLTLPTFPTATTTLITFTGQLAANLSTLPVVTSTLTASAGSVRLNGASLTDLTDGVPPTVSIVSTLPPVLQQGSNDLFGIANDGAGIGVEKVEILPMGSAQWQTVTGTVLWRGSVSVPNVSTFSVQVRATDFYGQVSPIQVFTFTVDNVGPTVNMTLPQYITATLAQIGGTTSDPFPSGGLVDKVEVQIGTGSAPWLLASGPYSPTQGSQGWNLTWSPPISDGVPIQLRARATDAAGNITVGTWQTTTVDTVAPVISVTSYTANIIPWLYATPARNGPPVLSGSVADGSGVAQMWMQVYGPHGAAYTETVTRTGTTWSYTPFLSDGLGKYSLRINAVDLAGNARVSDPFILRPPTIYLPLVMR